MWRITVRSGPEVEKLRVDTLPEALDALEERVQAAAASANASTIDLRVRRYEPEPAPSSPDGSALVAELAAALAARDRS